MIEAEIPGRRECLAVSDEGAKRTSDGSTEAVVPVMELVDCERGCDEGGAEKWSDGQNHLPVTTA